MSTKQFDLNYLRNEYGLSCVEDYVLYLIAQNNNWEQIFVDSYLTFEEVLKKILSGEDYSHFSGVPRLQKTGEELGLFRCKFYEYVTIPFEVVKDSVFLMQVSEEFVKDTFNKTFWRSDHYMLFRDKGGGYFEYLNDIPPSIATISEFELSKIYTGKIIKIDIHNSCMIDCRKLIQQCLDRINGKCLDCVDSFDHATLRQLRDAIGITKVLVKRMERLLQLFDSTFSLNDYYIYLQDYYIRIEYMRMKKKCDSEIPDMIKAIRDKDRFFNKQIRNLLQTTYIKYSNGGRE